MSKEDNQRAIESAANHYEDIRTHVAALGTQFDTEALVAISEMPLSVSVGYSGWYGPGEKPEPDEYQILLATGGPAVRVYGKLDDDNTPTSADLQWQDWGTPWSHYFGPEVEEEVLLRFAREFNFNAY